jgi:phenylacetate-coenzyme A ligase PaaK-like adenylate-forming protein
MSLFIFLDGAVLGRTTDRLIRGTNVYPTAVENLLTDVEGLSNNYEPHVSLENEVDKMEKFLTLKVAKEPRSVLYYLRGKNQVELVDRSPGEKKLNSNRSTFRNYPLDFGLSQPKTRNLPSVKLFFEKRRI